MILRNTTASWIPASSGIDTNGNAAKVQQQHAAQRKCIFGVGDRVTVQDYKDREHDYHGTIVGLQESAEYGWSATVELPDGKRVRKVVAKLRRRK